MMDLIDQKMAKISYQEKINRQLLHAASQGLDEDVDLLISSGADVNYIAPNFQGGLLMKGYTPLIAAAEKGHLVCLNKLIENGADVNLISDITIDVSVNSRGGVCAKASAMTEAAMNGQEDCFYRLASLCLDKDGIADSESLLSRLCVRADDKFLRMARYLLDQGANVDHQDDKGMTPLMMAIKYYLAGNQVLMGFVKLYIEHNSDLLLKDKEGNTIQDYVNGNGDPELQEIIQSAIENQALLAIVKKQNDQQDQLIF